MAIADGIADATVHRDFPVINGFVQVQPNHEGDKTRYTIAEFLAAVPGSYEVQMNPRTNPTTGSKFGAQTWVRVPNLTFPLNL